MNFCSEFLRESLSIDWNTLYTVQPINQYSIIAYETLPHVFGILNQA